MYLHTLGPIDVAHAGHESIEIAMLTIQLVHQEDNRLTQFVCIAEGILCSDFRTILSVDEDNSLVGHVQCRDGTTHKVIGTRTVNDIQFLVVPLNVEDGRKDRVTVFLLHGEIVADRVLCLHRTTTFDDAGFKQHTFGKSRLAATRTAKQGNVLDFVCLIYSHINIDLGC